MAAATGCSLQAQALIRNRRAFPLFLPACMLAATQRSAKGAPAECRLVAAAPSLQAMAAARTMNCMAQDRLDRQFTAQNHPRIVLRATHHHRRCLRQRLFPAVEDVPAHSVAEPDALRTAPLQ